MKMYLGERGTGTELDKLRRWRQERKCLELLLRAIWAGAAVLAAGLLLKG